MVYGGVSVFVVAFAVYPFAAELFRAREHPEAPDPATIALGSYTFAMDAVPGSPQIQNIIPTTFFDTTTMAAPWLGPIGGALHSRRRDGVSRMAAPQAPQQRAKATAPSISTSRSRKTRSRCVSPWLAFLPLVVVAATNIVFTIYIPEWYGATTTLALNPAAKPLAIDVSKQIGDLGRRGRAACSASRPSSCSRGRA